MSACPGGPVESRFAPIPLLSHALPLSLALAGAHFLSSSSLLSLARRLAGPLLQNRLFSVGEHGVLPLVDALQPVPEAPADAGEHGPGPERAAVEERPHLEAELPESGGDS